MLNDGMEEPEEENEYLMVRMRTSEEGFDARSDPELN